MNAEDIDPFIDDMFSNFDDNLEQEALNFKDSFQKKLDEQESIYNEFKKKHLEWYEEFKEFHEHFMNSQHEIEHNYKGIKSKKHKKEVLNNPINFAAFFDKFHKHNKDKPVPEWLPLLKDFFLQENPKIRENLLNVFENLKKSKITNEFKKERKKLKKDVKKQMEKILEIFVDEFNFDSFYLMSLKDVLKGVTELKLYDQVIQEFIWYLIMKIVEYLNNVICDYKTFRENTKSSLNKIRNPKLECEENFQIKGIHLKNPEEIRADRYEIKIMNEDLVSLQKRLPLNEKIIYFFVEFFRERNLNNEKFKNIYVNHPGFFQKLMPPGDEMNYNRINYEEVKLETERYNGKNHTIFHIFDKILYILQVDFDNWLVVEINNKNAKEIIIFDSNYQNSGYLHETVIDIFRAYMIEEYKNKGQLNEDESLALEREYKGRSIWCPQITNLFDTGLYALMNLKCLSEGGDISSKIYSEEILIKARNDFFGLVLMIGNSHDNMFSYEF